MNACHLTLGFCVVVLSPSLAWSQTVRTDAALRKAIENARPGAVITLAAGTYRLKGRLIPRTGGTPAKPITVRAIAGAEAMIETAGAEEAFQIRVPWWRFEDLIIHVAGAGSMHAYKLEENGQHITISGGKMILEPGAESGVKGAGGPKAPQPDFATIEGTEIFFTSPTTYSPAEGIDAVAVKGWIIRKNEIHGIRTAMKSVAYGAMTKGNSSGTIIEGNVFWDCFIPISLGGGGTDPKWMRDKDTSLESRGGVVRNNVTLHSDDVALYLYSAAGATVENNTFFDSSIGCAECSSIDVRMQGSSADIRNNLIDKPIHDRDGGKHTEKSNLISDPSWFVAPERRDLRLKAGIRAAGAGATELGDAGHQREERKTRRERDSNPRWDKRALGQ